MSNSPAAVLDWPLGAEDEHKSEDEGWVEVAPKSVAPLSDDVVDQFMNWIGPVARDLQATGRPAWSLTTDV